MLDMKNFPCHDPGHAKTELDEIFAVQMDRFDSTYRLTENDERCELGLLCVQTKFRLCWEWGGGPPREQIEGPLKVLWGTPHGIASD